MKKPYFVEPDLNGEGLQIGIVRARFNEEIGLAQQEACLDELVKLGVDAEDITVITVPGALEVGVTVIQMAETAEFDALIVLGAVVRGETYHFEVVSNESASAIARVSIGTGMPIANGILTVENEEQAQARVDEKGRDCAQAAVEMANLLALLEPSDDDFDFDEDDDEEGDDFDDN